jgi:hypothetical protein
MKLRVSYCSSINEPSVSNQPARRSTPKEGSNPLLVYVYSKPTITEKLASNLVLRENHEHRLSQLATRLNNLDEIIKGAPPPRARV